ncbi:MAG: SRPBCC family protein [Calditrichaeota bacterium]|nr:SRPBCC family protein [Calditrichota bacterium]
MKFLKIVIFVLIAIIVLLLLVALFLPSKYDIQRSVVMDCPQGNTFNLVADFNNWLMWNPWTQIDTTAVSEVAGPVGEIGSSWSWSGEMVGTGSLTITEIDSPRYISSELRFTQPRESVAEDIWIFEKTSEGTRVTWRNVGNLSYPVERYLGLFLENSILGPTFERGLQNLKNLCEEKYLMEQSVPEGDELQ